MRTRTALTAAAAAALIVVGTAGTATAGGKGAGDTNVKKSEKIDVDKWEKNDVDTWEKNGPVVDIEKEAEAEGTLFSGAIGKNAASVANQQVVNGLESPFNATQANPVVVFSPMF